MRASYKRFFAMIVTSTLIMFALMYSMVYVSDHIWWSDTKAFMALYMGAAMAVVMLAFMLGMYTDRAKNLAIVGGAAALFALGMWLARIHPSPPRTLRRLDLRTPEPPNSQTPPP